MLPITALNLADLSAALKVTILLFVIASLISLADNWPA